jgi:hypothetical protein
MNSAVRPPPPPLEVRNRRAARRRAVSVRVDVVPVLDAEGHPWIGSPRCGLTADLSPDGALAQRVGYLPLGAVVRAFLRLPDLPEDPVCCNARVVRCDLTDQPRYALKFVDLHLTDAERIRRALGRASFFAAPSWNYRFSS